MISVVIPLYNKEQSILSTLESVINQTYTDFEVIVVDDGSTDNSATVVKNIISSLSKAEQAVMRLFSKTNGGVCSARNFGIEKSRGEYIALLDGDDIWDKEYLAEQIKMIHDFPGAAMWGINFAEMNAGKLVRKLETGLPDGYRGYVDDYFQMKGRVSDLFCSSSVVIRKEVFDEVGMFDERIKYAEDDDMWWRIIATHRVAFYDRYMVYYMFDAENRALKREIQLKCFLPYFVEKYQEKKFRKNSVFFKWINQWAAQQLRPYFFSSKKNERQDASIAVKKLDYSVISAKYLLLYKMPRLIAAIINNLDKLRMRKKQSC